MTFVAKIRRTGNANCCLHTVSWDQVEHRVPNISCCVSLSQKVKYKRTDATVVLTTVYHDGHGNKRIILVLIYESPFTIYYLLFTIYPPKVVLPWNKGISVILP